MGTRMKIIDKRLKETADIIDRTFLKVDGENRPEISSDILPHLRHFCEAFMYKVYEIFKYPLTVLVVFFCIKLLYIISPDEKIPSKSTTYGAVFTTIAWIASTEIYAFYVGSFAHYDIFYGSISNILILLIWVYLLSYIFVAGMALNAYNVESKMLEEKKKSEENTNSKE